MGDPEDPESSDRSYDAAIKAVSTLITQRRRANGSNWGDYFSLMHEYLRVSLGIHFIALPVKNFISFPGLEFGR